MNDSCSFAELANWESRVLEEAGRLPSVDRRFRHLSLRLRAESPGIFEWIDRYHAPELRPATDETPAFEYNCIYSDRLVSEALHLLTESTSKTITDDDGLRRLDISAGACVIYDPVRGSVVYADRDGGMFHYVYSSRTRLPACGFADVVFEPLLRTLQSLGSTVFHAGAVMTPHGAILIVGYGSDGKTTLVSGLIPEGFPFVANERCFIDQQHGSFYVTAFPAWHNIGLGTALQHPGLARLLPVPDDVTAPQRRFDRKRVAATEPQEWAGLSDKLALVTDEFTSKLRAPDAVSHVPLLGVVRPRVSHTPVSPQITVVPHRDRLQLIGENYLSPYKERVHHPDWMNFCVSEIMPDVHGLGRLPAVEYTFSLQDGRIHGTQHATQDLVESLAAAASMTTHATEHRTRP